MPRMMVSRGDIARLFLPTRVIFHSVRSLREIVRSRLLRIRQVARPLQGCSPTSGGVTLTFNALLFKGNGITSEGVRDWVDLMTVPVDRTRFKVISDTVITIRSGNDSGVFRT